MSEFLNRYFRTIKKLVPESKPQSQVGVDIGVNSCKMVELKSTGGSTNELVGWAIEPVVGGDKAKAINAAVEKLTLPCISPSTAVSGKGTLIRYVDLARMTLDDLRKSFAIEADKYFPFPIDQIYTDCYILDPKSKDSKMSVLVAAAKKELIDERIKLLTGLGLQASFIGLNSTAMANVFNVIGFKKEGAVEGEQKDPESVALLDLGEEVSDLTILVDNIPRFTRDIFMGGRDFTKSISNALSVNFEEAEKLKCQPDDKREEVRKAIESVVLNLLSEVRLSFDYFVTERNTHISQLLLIGGSAMVDGLPEAFSKYLEIPVERWNPIATLNVSPEVDGDELKKNAGRLAVALGLALY